MEQLKPQLSLLRVHLTSFKNGQFGAKDKQDVINKAARLTKQARIAYDDGVISRLELDGMIIAIDEACIQYFNKFNTEA